jgi:HEAT repeat protein
VRLSWDLLWWIAALELALLVAGWIVLFASGARSRWKGKRDRRLRAVRDVVAAGVRPRSLTDEGRETLGALSVADQRAVVLMLARNLKGEEKRWLTELAGELGLIAAALRLCGSKRWWRRLEGARLLTLLGGGGDRVLRMAEDPHPLVRGQVAKWCGSNPSSASLHTLAGMLGDREAASRYAVQDALVRLHGRAAPPLVEELSTVEDPVKAHTALVAARAVGDHSLAPVVERLAGHASAHVRAAAFQALGRTGVTGSISLVEAGLYDRAATVRAAAALALGELRHWPAGPSIVRHLQDPFWDVRLAAGRALLLTGPPGRLLLRRAMRDEDMFVRDMARYTLDVADVVDAAT